ncbi:hypothetical protein CEP51_004868, partial [Fusarium floridanum]
NLHEAGVPGPTRFYQFVESIRYCLVVGSVQRPAAIALSLSALRTGDIMQW